MLLVISAPHMRDAWRPNDREARRLASLTRGPRKVEPWTTAPADIEIAPWGNVRDPRTAHAAKPVLHELEAARDAAFVADIAMKAVVRCTAEHGPNSVLSNTHEAIVVGSIYRLALGFESTAEDAIAWCVRAIDGSLTDADKRTLLERVMPTEVAMVVLSPYLAAMTADTRARFWDLMTAGPDNAPGTWLARQLAGSRTRNLKRDVERNDSVDVEHCAHFPYVDIATCNRRAYPTIAAHLPTARGSRRVKLFRNQDLQQVVDYIESL